MVAAVRGTSERIRFTSVQSGSPPNAEGRIIVTCMPSLSDSIFLFVLALLLFGPKKLPVLARELGKWVGEFRRASNEFKMQMEEELRISEQEDRRKQIAAMEAAAPPTAPIEEPEHPHLSSPDDSSSWTATETPAEIENANGEAVSTEAPAAYPETPSGTDYGSAESVEASATPEPLPIAESGDLRMMPPSTGLPTPRSRSTAAPASASGASDALDSLVSAIPHRDEDNHSELLNATEGAAHGH